MMEVRVLIRYILLLCPQFIVILGSENREGNTLSAYKLNQGTRSGSGIQVLTHDGHLSLQLGNNFTAINISLPAQTGTNFLLFQSHSQGQKVEISTAPHSLITGVFGSNIGVVYFTSSSKNSVVFYLRAPNATVTSQVFAPVYSEYDPIPGGCCLIREADPNLEISHDAAKTYIKFTRGNIFDRDEPCDGKPYANLRLRYTLYLYYLEEGNFKESSVLDGLWKMSSVANIKKYGTKVSSPENGLSFTTMTVDRQAVIYNVIIEDPKLGSASAYTPGITYGCNFDPVRKKCTDKRSVLLLVYSLVGGVLGLLMCFAGLKLFKLQLLLSGMTTVWLIVFVCLSRLTDLSLLDRMLISTSAGIVGGFALLGLWLKTELVHLCLANNGLLLGVLIAGIVYYSPLGYYSWWHQELIFFLTFQCIVFAAPIFLIFFPKVLSIFSSSWIGAYAMIVAVNHFINGTLVYIVKCFILRMSVKDYSDVYMWKPFQRNDIILCCFWFLLTLAGIFVQYFMTKDDDVFKRNSISTSFSVRPRRLRVLRQLGRKDPERAPLLGQPSLQAGYSAITEPYTGSEAGEIGNQGLRNKGNGERWKGNRPNVV